MTHPSFARPLDQAGDQTTVTAPTLAGLLDQVAATGRPLTPERLRGLRFARGTQRDRDTARRRIAHHSRQIAAAVRDGDPQVAADLAEATVEMYRHLVDTDPPARPAPPPRPTGHTHRDPTAWKDVTALHELLLGASVGVPPDARDLERLPVRPDATGEQVAQWHDTIRERAQRIHRLYTEGDQGAARQLARDTARQLGGLLADPEDNRPDRHDLGPRELAALIPRGA